ncbi:hypothetical protein [Megasphaera sp.]|jgi:hypothetical protein|uniref:XkdQ/YqbQ family protein n=1 Tax=Megasphaera sp. TaxID=2023260 RepID=UPI0025BA06B3|nr:hypothetical protein [Megasphaera sp.]
MFQLVKINKESGTSSQKQENQQNGQPKHTDLSAYVISYTWSGDVEQAGRKLEFDIAYTTKDKDWTNAILELGNEVRFSYTDEVTQETYPVFQGRIFSRSRDSESYTMRFVAFDNIIYLAKSRITRKYANVTVADAIRQTIHDFSIEAGTMPDLSVVCSFIADDISATDAIKQALSYQSAQDGKGYHIYMTDGKLNVVCTNDQVVENFFISDEINLTGASVSESIEDMVSKVIVVDSTGQTKGEMPNNTDIQKFGIIQAVCKADPKQDDASQARAMLKTVAHDMAVHALGHIQCIAGFSVDIQEEQLKGRFFIKSDSHRMEGNKHTMDLNLVFNKLLNEQKQELGSASYNANPDYVPPATTSSGTSYTGNGTAASGDTVDQCMSSFDGTVSPYGSEGCVDRATIAAAGYSPFAAQEYNNNVKGCDQLRADAEAQGLAIPYDPSQLEKGDIIMYNRYSKPDPNWHVVVYDGNGGCWGNSSNVYGCFHHYEGSIDMGSDYYPATIIKTSRG